MTDAKTPAHPGPGRLRRLLPLVVLVTGLAAFFALDLDRFVTFDALRENRGRLLAYVAAYPLLAPVVFGLVYVAAAAFSLPIALPLSLTAGFLFGLVEGLLVVVTGASLGAILFFLAARTAIGETLAARAGPRLRRMEQGFRDNAVSYMLFLRLFPFFPFWMVNLAAAIFGAPLRVFVITTFFGIMPASFIIVNVGRGLGAILDSGAEPSIRNILTADILLALTLLGLLALAPVIHRKLKARRAPGGVAP
jgi:uncharacterized membrane protein YdjX (TVP38/TMEM64 family)